MTQRTSKLVVLSFSLSLGLCACGGGGGGGSASTQSGQFFDALVSGLEYSGGGLSDVTDEAGVFRYEPGQDVTFFLGDIVLGTLSPQALLSPVDLEETAEDYDDSTRVLNIARFLQTLDSDMEPANGIQITQAVRDAAVGLQIDFETADLDSDPVVQGIIGQLTSNPIVSEAAALQHAHAWLAASRAGEYSGTFESTAGPALSGQWRLSVGNTGEITMIVSDGTGNSGGSSQVAADGSFTVVLVEGTFIGQIQASQVQGTWSHSLPGTSGTFGGSLEHQALTFLDPSLIVNFSELDGATITGDVLENGVDLVATFTMDLSGTAEGLYSVGCTVFIDGTPYECSFYGTSMTASTLDFRGLSTTGEGFIGELSSDGVVVGTYYGLDASEPGGTFSGNLGG